MSEEKELTRGQKSYYKRLINEFNEAKDLSLSEFEKEKAEALSSLNILKVELLEQVKESEDQNRLVKEIVSDNKTLYQSKIEELEELYEAEKKELQDFYKSEIETYKSLYEVKKEELSGFLEETKDKIVETEAEFREKTDEIKAFHQLIFEEDEEDEVLSDDIKKFRTEFIGHKSEIEKIKLDIKLYNNELFGYVNSSENIVPGIKDKIKEQEEQIDLSVEFNNKKQDDLFNKIEGLLKGASTVALAKAFNEHKDSFNTSNKIWLGLFVASVTSMMIFTLLAFKDGTYELQDMWKYTLGNLPFLGGAIWIAIYSSKQRSQNKRLQQEYAFKEDVAKIYYGLKQEIEDLGTTEIGKKLNTKMLETILFVVGDNPSKTLDSSSHNDKGPVLEALNNVSSMIKDLKS